MKFTNLINTIDTHTAGEPTRIITGGMPFIPGATMLEKKEWVAHHHDGIRTALMLEPRGHADMFGAVVTPPVSADAEAGVMFMDGGGYLDMCGHGSIGVVTALLESGMLPIGRDPERIIILDTPAGTVRARAEILDDRVVSVSIQNVPSFLLASTAVELRDFGRLPVDIAYGGNFFALVDVNRLGLKIQRRNVPRLVAAGLDIREAVNRGLDVSDPRSAKPATVALVEFFDETTVPPTNMVVFGQGQVDRSPCGTGTSAKMAVLHAHGKLQIGETYTYRSVMGTAFTGRLLSVTRLGDMVAVVPEITGSAFITGMHQFVLNDADPFRFGFRLHGN